jgi:hypothetical protein
MHQLPIMLIQRAETYVRCEENYKHGHQCTLGVSGELVLEVKEEESECLLMSGQ